ncbi:MAG: sulfatase-like hydrolase/transferase [bacterium]|nr:sulfatase-like hydrolase/transferase [bacterium]
MRLKNLRSWSVLTALNVAAALILYLFFQNDLMSLTQGNDKLFIFRVTLAAVIFAVLLLWTTGMVLILLLNFRSINYFASMFSAIFFIFLFIDVQVFVTTGMHLYSSFVIGNLMQNNIFNELHFEANTVIAFIMVFIGVFFVNGLIAFLTLKLADFKISKYIGNLFVTVFAVSFAGILIFFLMNSEKISKNQGVETVPFFSGTYSFLFEKDPADLKKLEVNYPYKTFADIKIEKKPDILMIFVESLRADIFNSEIMPVSYSFAKEKCITSRNHHSAELSTIYSTFAFLYGLNIHHYYPFHFRKTRSVPIRILKNNGYVTIGAAASNLKDMSIHSDVLYDQFDKYKEFFDNGWKKDRKMVDWIKKQSNDKKEKRPRFYFAFFQSTHHNYYYPPEFEKHVPVIESDFNYLKGTTLKERKIEVKNRYLNAAGYVDSLIGELLEHFKDKIESGEIIIALAGDHGEEFWDIGALGHGKISNNFRSRVPFALCLPGIEHKEVELSSHVDILPTIISYLNPLSDTKKWSDGISLLGEIPQNRYITVGGFDFPRRSTEVTLINNHGKLFLNKTTDSINPENKFRIIKRTDLEDRPDPNLSKELDWMMDQFAIDMNRFFSGAN